MSYKKLGEEKEEKEKRVVKKANEIRWSSRYNACYAFKNSRKEFIEILNDIGNDISKKNHKL